MNILEIYEKYQIMPQLIEHQLRVAGVASLIVDNLTLTPTLSQRERENIVAAACLLHDMGNIVKFDFSLFPEIVAEKGLEYWQGVKKEIAEKYGDNSHEATRNILKEIGVSERILELVDCVGFDQGIKNLQSPDFGKKVCAYSDMRVLPLGVGSLEERMADLRARYKNRPEGAKDREQFEAAIRQIEQQIFVYCKIRPEGITDENIELSVEKLKNWEI